jgi:hypothetical protein
MVGHARENAPCFVETATGKEQFDDVHVVFAPFLDLAEVTSVGIERIIGFFAGPIVGHCIKHSTQSGGSRMACG